MRDEDDVAVPTVVGPVEPVSGEYRGISPLCPPIEFSSRKAAAPMGVVSGTGRVLAKVDWNGPPPAADLPVPAAYGEYSNPFVAKPNAALFAAVDEMQRSLAATGRASASANLGPWVSKEAADKVISQSGDAFAISGWPTSPVRVQVNPRDCGFTVGPVPADRSYTSTKGDFVFATGGVTDCSRLRFDTSAKEIFRVTPEGQFVLGTGVTNDEAARLFAKHVNDHLSAFASRHVTGPAVGGGGSGGSGSEGAIGSVGTGYRPIVENDPPGFRYGAGGGGAGGDGGAVGSW